MLFREVNYRSRRFRPLTWLSTDCLGSRLLGESALDQAAHNQIVSFIWGIADEVLRPHGSRPRVTPVTADDN